MELTGRLVYIVVYILKSCREHPANGVDVTGATKLGRVALPLRHDVRALIEALRRSSALLWAWEALSR